MIIVGKQNCPKCKELRASLPNVRYIEMPDVHIGLGDTICDIACWLKIAPCSSCRVRQLWLNKIFPYWWNRSKIHPDYIELKQRLLKLRIKYYPVKMNDSLTEIID